MSSFFLVSALWALLLVDRSGVLFYACIYIYGCDMEPEPKVEQLEWYGKGESICDTTSNNDHERLPSICFVLHIVCCWSPAPFLWYVSIIPCPLEMPSETAFFSAGRSLHASQCIQQIFSARLTLFVDNANGRRACSIIGHDWCECLSGSTA